MTNGLTRRRWLAVVTAVLLTLGAAGCSGLNGPGNGGGRFTDPDKLRVVATYSILGDLVRNVTGDLAQVVVLVGPDGDTHTYEPTPQDAMTLADAQVIFENGVGYETWLDKLYRSSRTSARRVVVTEGLEFREGQCFHTHKDTEPHDHDDDPHVWHDVKNAMHMVGVIRDRLCEIDPARDEVYRANAATYLTRLEQLHAWVEEQVETVPAERRKLVTNHDTFGYFADRYGFKVVGAVLPSVSTELADPSGAQVAKLIETVKRAGVPVVFAENVQSTRLAERLAQEAGIKLAPPLYSDALGPPGSPADTYEKMVRYNVGVIVAALKP